MISDYCVIDYAETSAQEMATLLLDGWEAAPGTHDSLIDHDDLSYIVLVKQEEPS